MSDEGFSRKCSFDISAVRVEFKTLFDARCKAAKSPFGGRSGWRLLGRNLPTQNAPSECPALVTSKRGNRCGDYTFLAGTTAQPFIANLGHYQETER